MPAPLTAFDVESVRWLAAHRVAALDWCAALLSVVGRSGALWIGIGLLGLAVRRMRPQAAFQTLLAVLLALVVSDVVLKPLVARSRPADLIPTLTVLGPPASNAAFPSGHAATAFAAAVALGRAWPGARGAVWVLAVLMGLARVYAGAHFPTDVIAGAVVGWLSGRLVVGRTSWSSHGFASRTSPVARQLSW